MPKQGKRNAWKNLFKKVEKLKVEKRRCLYANIVKGALVSHHIASSIPHTGKKPYICNHCKSIAFGPHYTTSNRNEFTQCSD